MTTSSDYPTGRPRAAVQRHAGKGRAKVRTLTHAPSVGVMAPPEWEPGE